MNYKQTATAFAFLLFAALFVVINGYHNDSWISLLLLGTVVAAPVLVLHLVLTRPRN